MKFILAAGIASALRVGYDPTVDNTRQFSADYAGAKLEDREFEGTEGFAPAYERVVPEQFTDQHDDDMFMHSMITNYAHEGRDDATGAPNGKFFLDKDNAYRASEEVVSTHLHLQGKELKDYLTYNFDEAWDFYDVNRENSIEADRMSTFFRYLCKNAALNI